MPLSIECPNCASRYKVGDHLAGKRVKCKKCAGGIHVPDPQDLEKAKELPLRRDPEEMPPPLDPLDPIDVFKKRQRPRPQPEPKKSYPPEIAETFVAKAAFELAPAMASVPSPFTGGRQKIIVPAVMMPNPLARTRDIRSTTAAPEGFSPLLLLVYLIVELAGTIYLANKPHAQSSVIWTASISEILLFFAVVAPMTWLGIWGASQAMRFELASPAYIKSAAVAVAPGMLVLLLRALPSNPALLALGLLAIFPAAFAITKLVFSLSWLEAVVAFLLGGIGLILGRLIQFLLIVLIIASAGPPSASNQVADADANPSSTYTSPVDPTPPQVHTSAGAPSPDSVVAQLDRIEQLAEAMSRGNWLADSSRENATGQLTILQNQVGALRPRAMTVDQTNKLTEVSGALSDLAGKIAQLPSEAPDALVFKPIDSGPTWRPSSGDATVPVSFRRYRMQVPTDAKVDLGSSEDAPDGVTWTILPRGQINITAFDRKDPRQERPWLKTRGFMKSDDNDLFTLDLVNIPVDITYGKLGMLPATRIASRIAAESPNHFVPDRFVKYVLADGKSWVVINCVSDAGDARTLNTLENAAFSIRQARGDEPRIDPFTPEAMVGRLREERAEVIVRRMGTKAEPALLARINDSDGLLRGKVLELLADCGTKNSLPALLPLCSDDNTRYADLARAAVKKISPADMDLPAEALLQIQSKNFQSRQRGVEVLASAQPAANDPRRAKVCAILTGLVRDGHDSFGIKPESLGDAIAVWQTPDTVTSLLPMLDYKGDFMRRKTAMVVLAHTKDRRAAFPICRWLIEDTNDAQDALTSMGPVAEDDVIKVLSEKNDKARLAAVNILAEIGTQKSLKPLGYVVSDKKAYADVDAGNAAIAEIRQRIAKPSAAPDPKSAASGERPQANDPGLNGNIWIPPTSNGPPRTGR